MKSTLTILICLIFTGSAAAQSAPPRQSPLMAEDVFKDIPALKGIPVDEFMDTMGMFSAALSMNCTDCHTEDSTSDWPNFAKDTPLKQTARRMTLMVNSINKNNFGGKPMVSCYTCHHGEQKAKSTPSLVIQYSSPFEDPNEVELPPNGFPNAPSANQVFDNYLKSVGGAQKAAGLMSVVAKGTYEGYDTQGGKPSIELYVKATGQRATIVRAFFGDKITVFNGSEGWYSSPDRPAPLIPLTGGNLEGARLDTMIQFPAQLKQMAKQWRSGATVIDDKDVILLQGTNGDAPPVNLYFDESTGLLVRMLRFAQTAIGRVPTQIDFSDYRDVGGLKMPFRRITTWTDNRTTTQFTEIQPNATIEASRFAKPAPASPPKFQ